VAGVPIRVMYIPARAPCSWLRASQKTLIFRFVNFTVPVLGGRGRVMVVAKAKQVGWELTLLPTELVTLAATMV
jgi:hypothetical protein